MTRLTNSSEERKRWEKLWRKRASNPLCTGLKFIREIKSIIAPRSYDVIVDFGCGDGSSTHFFYDQNTKHIIGIDIVDARVASFPWQFIQTPLWDINLIEKIQDFAITTQGKIGGDTKIIGLCLDVLEHIPEQFIETVLRVMSDSTDLMVFLVTDKYTDRDALISGVWPDAEIFRMPNKNFKLIVARGDRDVTWRRRREIEHAKSKSKD